MITFEKKTPTETLRYVRDYARVHFADGGYPLALQMRDGGIVCGPCARLAYRRISEETKLYAREGGGDDSWIPVAMGIHYEGAPLLCEHGMAERCLGAIESAYGNPYEDA